jgi:hypothetical protein
VWSGINSPNFHRNTLCYPEYGGSTFSRNVNEFRLLHVVIFQTKVIVIVALLTIHNLTSCLVQYTSQPLTDTADVMTSLNMHVRNSKNVTKVRNKVERISISSKRCCYPDVNYEHFWQRRTQQYRSAYFSLPLIGVLLLSYS